MKQRKYTNADAIKVVSIAAAISAAVAGMYIFYNPTNHRAIYGNKVDTYIKADSARKANVAYLFKHGFNAYAGYGVRELTVSNRKDVQDYVLRLRRAGVKDVGFIYGSENAVLNELDKYQKSCTNDSMKFSHVVSEIEQYQSDGNRPKFYATIRKVSEWALKNKVKRYIYQGWPNQTDCDSIVKYSDRTYMHAYGQYDKYSNPGDWVYGYTKSRMAAYAKSVSTIYGSSSSYKYNIVLLYSCENPDQSKTQFGYKYFLTKSVGELHGSFSSHYKLNVPSSTSSKIEIGGWVLFVEDQFKKIRP